MSRKEAKEVEREYYEFRKQREAQRRAGAAPVKSATSARSAMPQGETPTQPEMTVAPEKNIAPDPSPITAAPAQNAIPEQTIPPSPEVTSIPDAMPPEDADTAADIMADETCATPQPASRSILAEEDDEYAYPDDEADADEEGDEYEGEGLSGILKGFGSKLGLFGSALTGKIASLRHAEDEEEEADEETDHSDFLRPISQPDEAEVLDSTDSSSLETAAGDAPAEVPAEDDDSPSDSLDIPMAFDLSVDDEVPPQAGSVVMPYDVESDEEEEESDQPSFLNGVLSKVMSLLQRHQTDDEETDDSPSQPSEPDEASFPEVRDDAPESVPSAISSFEYEDEEDVDFWDEGEAPEFVYEETQSDEAQTDNDAQGAYDMEGDLNIMDNKQKSMTELMAEGMSESPALSRRERRMLSDATGTQKKSAAGDELDQLNSNLSGDDEEPTVEYKPVRVKPIPAKAAPKKPIIDDEDDEDDDDEDIKPSKKEKAKKAAPKRPVYDDDDDDDEVDDEDDDLDEEYDDDEEEISIGKRIFGFIKGFIAIFLVLALLVLALRIAESGNHISLDWVRDKIGSKVGFVNTLFPDPAPEDILPTVE